MRTLAKLLKEAGTDHPHNDVTGARRVWEMHRMDLGFKSVTPLLTAPDGNVKLAKSVVPTYGLSLSPARTSLEVNVCPYSTRECRDTCLATAGHGRWQSAQDGRAARTTFFQRYPHSAHALLVGEIEAAVRRFGHIRMRLNVLSDLDWENIWPDLFGIPGVQFYDYTKNWSRESTDAYHLTYSASERTKVEDLRLTVSQGRNVAVVVPTETMARQSTWHGLPAVCGDDSDDRTLDPRGCVVLLKAKGAARYAPYGPTHFVKTEG